MKYIYKLKNKSQTLPLQVLAVALIAVVILLFTSGILSSNSERLVTAAQDAACRAYLESSATTIARLGSSIEQLVRAEQTFFGQLPRYCRTEFLILEQRNEEYVSQRFSDAAQRCYNRYGAGELNFLGYTQREGSFCFICAEIEFENADSQDYQSYRYLDIATFMENEIPQQRNEERKNARELANLFYVDIKGGESALINTDLRIQSRFSMYGEDTLPYFLNALENYEYFKNIYQREFRVQDKTYVVYRYELTSSDFDSLLAAQQLQGALTSAASNYASKRIACAGKGIVASISSGPGAAIVGTLSTIGCVGSAAIGLFGLYSTVSQINLLQADIPLIMSIFKFPGIETELTPQQEISLQLISNWLNDIDSFNYEDLNQISPFILNNLEGDPRRTYDRINRGDTNINQNSLQELVSQIALRQVSIITNTQDSFDFEQYVEIMPQSDFYRECGVVTNTNLRR